MKLGVRRLALAAVPVLALSGVAGCSIQEQTQRWYTATDGVNANAGDIGLRNVQVVSDGEGRATLIATFANSGDEADELTEVLIGDVPAELSAGLEIPAGGTAVVGPDGDRVDGQDVEAEPGRTVTVEFRFGSAPRTTVQAIVVPAEDDYADALSESGPTGEETPTDDATPTDEPTGDAGATDGTEPTSEATGEAEPTDGAEPTQTGTPASE
ncbi:hypothetical protein [Jiangella asiatica]|uniref:DNA modification methylase n=1 Tax=Jiangella asiatica TaxID=2530372 RepID=A0A4R5DEY6_9ACTN|nr:hypothetical protein [Jiangella asiatica]TDE10431.1 hypothetical protein E1269_12135 [Jiangella asiatica]